MLLHGWCCSSMSWRGVIDLLRPAHRCLAPDLRGHGASSVPRDHAFFAEALANDVLAICEAAGVERPVLIGHSFGGYLAAEVVRRSPGFARAAVIVDQHMDFAALGARLQQASALVRGEATHLAFRDSMCQSLMRAPTDVLPEHVERPRRETPVDVALGVWAPLFEYSPDELRTRSDALLDALSRGATLFVDREEMPGYHAALVGRGPHVTVRVLPGGHSIHVEQPEPLVAAVRELLSTLP